MNAERLAEIRERDAEYTDELLDGWRKLFERHAMKCDRAIVDRHDLLAEVDRLTRDLEGLRAGLKFCQEGADETGRIAERAERELAEAQGKVARLVAPLTEPVRMDAYYYSFNDTEVAIIDRILSAVATAGKRFHLTADWNDEYGGQPSPAQCIQDAADAAADAIRAALSGGAS